jgi:hypothetical protein
MVIGAPAAPRSGGVRDKEGIMEHQLRLGTVDFRDSAAAASREALARLRCSDPLTAGISLCVEAEGDGRGALRRVRRFTLVRLIVGFILMLVGAGIMYAADVRKVLWLKEKEEWLIPGAVIGFMGFLAIMGGPFLQRRLVDRYIRDRLAESNLGESGPPPAGVEVEDSRTFQKPKILPEDLARVLFDPDQRRLVIEGIVYRYVIYASDVMQMRTVKSSASLGLQIVYNAAGVPLGLTLSHDSVLSYLRRATIGGNNPLIRRAQQTLGEVPVAKAGQLDSHN